MSCESVRGEWGKPCPDCGETLPKKQGPLRSWQAQRDSTVPFGTVSGRPWTERQREAHRVQA